MNSRQRFETTCRHKMPDRFLMDFHGHPQLEKQLMQRFGVETEEQFLQKLHCDFYYLSCRDISQNESCLSIYKGPALHKTETERVCPFGIRWKRGAGNSKFFVDDALEGPLESAATPKEVLEYEWPRPEWFDFEPLVAECEAHSDWITVGGFWTGFFGDSYRMHGFQNFLMNIVLNPELIQTLVKRMTDFYLKLNDSLFSALKGKLDVFYFGNDFGTQHGLLFSKDMWLDFFFESTKQIVELAHQYGFKVMCHSCGAITELIPFFIEAGVDIVDPVQITAHQMEPEKLKSQFGGKIIFHGGVDTQQIMPKATPEEVRDHCTHLMETLGRGGDFILAPSNLLGADVPLENVEAMYQTGRECRGAEEM